jgi:transcription elongation factor GreA
MSDDRFPMTPACKKKLHEELRRIKEVERPQNVAEIETALDHGDLRENAEYHAAKEKQAELAARMKYLEYRMGRAVVIDPVTIKNDRVSFGATVKLLDVDTDEELTYALIGEDEADVDRGRLSINSPVARALIGKEEGDEVTVRLPKGTRELEILSVEYKALD